MIFTINERKSRNNRNKKRHNPLARSTKIIVMVLIFVIPVILGYNYLFTVKHIVAPIEIKVAADRAAFGKSLFAVNKKSIFKQMGKYPDFDITITKMIPGKLIIEKKDIEPVIFIENRDLYVDNKGEIFRTHGKSLYAKLKVFGVVENSQIGNLLNIAKTNLFKTIYARKGYYVGKIGSIKVSFTTLNNRLIKRLRFVMSQEPRKVYSMDLRFKNQVIIR